MRNLKPVQKTLLVSFALILLVGVVSASPLPVYRFWDYKYGNGHLYTLSENEKGKILGNYSDVWTYEGVAFYAYKDKVNYAVPVYRFWNNGSGTDHLYTISESEKEKILGNYSDVWTYEGVAFYAYKENWSEEIVPVYRFWNNGSGTDHLYTISESEKEKILGNYSDVWTYEGVAFYACKVNTGCGTDKLAPVVALTSPTNYKVFPQAPESVNFVFSVFDQSAISSCSLKVNDIWVNKSDVNIGLNNINVTLSEGEYTAEVYCTDVYNNTGKSNKVYFAILKGEENDATAPMSISGLKVVSKTNESISWNWTNPTDSDFGGTLIYINGENVINLPSTKNSYSATGLQANTSYTIVIYTKDFSGNVNNTGISSTAKTLPNEEDEDEDEDDGSDTSSKKSKKKSSIEDSPIIFTSGKDIATATNYSEGEVFLGGAQAKVKLNWLPCLLFFLVVLILIALILIIKNI